MKMTLDEAIEYYTKVATQRAIADEEMGVNDNSKWNETKFMTKKESEQIIADNQQLTEWLTELKERRERCAQYEVEQISNLEQYDMLSREYEMLNERYKEAKRLLKAAVEDFNKSLGAMYTCPYCKYVKSKEICASRETQYCGDICKWRYADEALKLIGDE